MRGLFKMNRIERDLLVGIAEEIVLQLRAKLSEIESLHPRESALSIATFQERLWSLEDLVEKVRAEAKTERGS
jgi:hypothetical protein